MHHREQLMTSLVIRKGEAGRSVADLLRARFRLSKEDIRGLVQNRRVRLNGVPCPDPKRRVRAGERLTILPMPRGSRPPAQPRQPQKADRKSVV
jgi:hypothetical protein